MEGPSSDPITVTVHLPKEQDLAETIAEQAMGTIVALLDDRHQVVLTTMELGGSKIAPVTDRRSAARRLARAVPDPDEVGR